MVEEGLFDGDCVGATVRMTLGFLVDPSDALVGDRLLDGFIDGVGLIVGGTDLYTVGLKLGGFVIGFMEGLVVRVYIGVVDGN